MSPAIPTDTRPLIDRLREAVPGLEWYTRPSEVVGGTDNCSRAVVANSKLLCWLTKDGEPHAVNIDRPSDDEVVRIVKDWYAKTHPAKDQEKRQVEKLREAIERGAPGVTVQVSRIEGAFDLKCYGKAGHLVVSLRDGLDALTPEQLEKTLARVRECCLKPVELDWSAALLERLHKETCGSWIITTYGPSGRAVSSSKGDTRFVVTQADDGRYEFEVSRKDGQPQRSSRRSEAEIIDLARVLCKSREDEMKPTNTTPVGVNTLASYLNSNTPDSWLAEQDDGQWLVTSAKNGQKLVATLSNNLYRLEVREGGSVLPYRDLTLPALLELTNALCKARADLVYRVPREVDEFVLEMRVAGFAAGFRNGPGQSVYSVTVRSTVDDGVIDLFCGPKGWMIAGQSKLYTRSAISSLVRLELTKQPTKYRSIEDLRAELVTELIALGEVPLSSHDGVVIEYRNYSVESTNKHIIRSADSIETLAREMVTSLASEREKMVSAEHEAFERKAREATTQYLQNAGMSVTIYPPLTVTAKMRAEALIESLTSTGVVALLEVIDDHAAVCVTDPSTGEVHKAICDPAGNWLMDGEEVYGLVAATELRELGQRQKKEKAMGKSTRRQRIEQGIYLGAAKSATDKARDGVVALLASGLPAEEQAGARAVLAKILETEIGAGAFGFVMGEAVDLAAGQFEGESPKVEAFAEALQVVGAMRGANTVIDALFEPITSAISGMIAAIPEPPKVRATPDAPAEEHEEPAHTGRKARAAR